MIHIMYKHKIHKFFFNLILLYMFKESPEKQ
jgi:hypothetical protein